MQVPAGVSNRHVHLSQEDLEKLFGAGYELTKLKDLSQQGEFAARETVSVIGPKGIIEGVRILGPVRKETQVEISRTDGFRLGIDAPVRQSGHLEGTPGCLLVGPKGVAVLEKGVIVAAIHIHMSPSDAQKANLKDGDKVTVFIGGQRPVTFHEVLVRVHPRFRLELHLDTDEANAAWLNNGDKVWMVKDQQSLSMVG